MDAETRSPSMRPETTTSTLAAREPGEEFLVRRILSTTLREYFRELNLEEGERARVEGASAAYLRVRTSRERVVLIDRDYARSVEVAPLAHTTSPQSSPDGSSGPAPGRKSWIGRLRDAVSDGYNWVEQFN